MILVQILEKMFVTTSSDIIEVATTYNLVDFLLKYFEAEINNCEDAPTDHGGRVKMLCYLIDEGDIKDDAVCLVAEQIVKAHKTANTYDLSYNEDDAWILIYRVEPQDAEDFAKFIAQYAKQYKDNELVGKMLEVLI